jgi:plasmid stabilization system protein ParE
VNFKIKPSSQFSADLRAILNFIGDDDASGARRVLSETNRKIGLLKKRPLAFRLRPELGQDFRAIRVFSYLLVYHTENNTVFLDRLVHSSQDIEAIFEIDEDL